MLNKIKSTLDEKDFLFSIYGENREIENILAIEPNLNNAFCYFTGEDISFLNTLTNCIICITDLPKIYDLSKDNTYIVSDNPQLLFYYCSILFQEENYRSRNVQIDSRAEIGLNLKIKSYSVIENCCIGNNVEIGSNVYIRAGSIIGNDVIIESNTVIGANGVMWTGKDKVKCIQTGDVIINNNVFIGSNISIVRGSFKNKPTIIDTNTHISHGTMIGHSCIIKNNNHLANNVTLAGSVTLNENCFLGSACCVIPHITIPKKSIVGANSVVITNYLKEGQVLIGNPALQKKPNKLNGLPSLI